MNEKFIRLLKAIGIVASIFLAVGLIILIGYLCQKYINPNVLTGIFMTIGVVIMIICMYGLLTPENKK